ncbi:MAG: VWA domain-containing protein [Acidimicrobiia bacterium]|nr:VWA domain-containing protein [Acidimicrobiia bacterium]
MHLGVVPTDERLNMRNEPTHDGGDADSTLVTFILDESGSMGSIADEARTGFNGFVKEQTAQSGKTWWTLTTFNNTPRTRFAVIPGAEVRPLTDHDYQPNGMTALLDAVGHGIRKTRRFLDTQPSQPDGVLFVVLTDGMENASHRYTRREVAAAISDAEEHGWQFIYLGANQDSWTVARDLGMTRAAVVDWSADEEGIGRAMEEVALSAARYRLLRVQQESYTDRRDR